MGRFSCSWATVILLILSSWASWLIGKATGWPMWPAACAIGVVLAFFDWWLERRSA